MAILRGNKKPKSDPVKIDNPNPHKDLCVKARKLLKGRFGCAVAVSELVSLQNETPDAFGFRNGGLETYLIEVKTSRSDFLADKKKSFRIKPENGLGLYRYFLAPKGLIKIDELPEKWGLIEVCEKGLCNLVRGKDPRKYGDAGFSFVDRNRDGEMTIIYSICRRLIAGDDCSRWI